MKQLLVKYKYFFSIFILLMLCVITYLSDTLDPWSSYCYVMNYSSGLGPRRLIGTLINLLSGDFIEQSFVLKFVVAFYIFGSVILSFECNGLLVKTKSCGKEIFVVSVGLVLLYFVGPASVSFLFKSPNFSKLDFFLFLINLLVYILFVNRDRMRSIYFILLLLLTSVSMLIHQVYACSYLPVIVALMIYDCADQTNLKTKLIFYCGTLLFLFILFLKLNFLSFSSIELEHEMSILSSKTDIPLYKPAVYYNCYGTLDIHLRDFVLPSLEYLTFGGILEVVLLFPLFYFFYRFWAKTIKNANSEYRKYIYIFMQIVFIMILPAFFIIIDYQRLFGAFVFSQFSLLFILIYEQDINIMKSCIWLYTIVVNHLFESVILVLYMSSITLFGSTAFSPSVEHIMVFIHKVILWLSNI